MKRVASRFIAVALLLAFSLTTVGCGVKVNTETSDNSDVTSSTTSTSTEDTSSPQDDTSSSEDDVTGSDGNTTSSPNNTQGGNSKPTSGNNKTTKPVSNYNEPKFDLKGREIVIASEHAVPNMARKNIFNESITLTEKKFNVKFKFVQQSNFETLYRTLINDHAAGKATYDAVNLRGYEIYPNAANSGAILELDKYYDFANDPTWNVDIFKTLGKFKGKRYAIPHTPNDMGNGIWYNRELLNRFNVPDLWTYVKNDTWNWNTFRAVAKKLTQDTNGDGKPDYWAFTSSDPWLDFIYSNNATLVSSGVNGAPKISIDSKNAIEAIQFIADLHMIDNTIPDGKELGEITDKPFNAMFTGKVAMATYHARYGAVLEQMGIPSKNIGWVYLPKGPAAKTYVAPTGTLPDMYVIPRHVSAPKDVVAAVQDLAAYWDVSREIKRDIYDKTEELYNALSSSLDANAKSLLMYQAKNPVFTYSNNYNLSHTLQNELWPSILKGKSVKSAVDSIKSKMQKEVTDKYKGTVVS
jgi:hypothetical protein